MFDMEDSSMENALKKVAVILGVLLLSISIYLSYDGFDQGVTGGNTGYSQLAKAIGIVIAIAICAIQFIFGSRYSKLNATLKVVGFASYAYSIYTNYLGAQHILMMSGFTAIATAVFLDVVPEPMISWGLGDSANGDALGNIGKWFTGGGGKPAKQEHSFRSQNQDTQPRPEFRPNAEAMEKLAKAQGLHQMQERRNGAEQGKQHQGGKQKNHHYRG
jgi:hypothetical protein